MPTQLLMVRKWSNLQSYLRFTAPWLW